MSLSVELIAALEDNYIYVLRNGSDCVLIDPGDAAPALKYLDKERLRLTAIWITHHHWDHTNGVSELKERTNCQVIGPEKERAKISALDQGLQANDFVFFDRWKAKALEIPGHTLGHMGYWFEEEGILFTGDTLFSMGCGRLFEGSASQLYESLQKLKALPLDTKIYCGHEYTLKNLKFAIRLNPENKGLLEMQGRIKNLREGQKPSLPTSVEVELALNPFLLAKDAGEFAELRKMRDLF